MEDQAVNIRVEDLPLLAEGLRALYANNLRAKETSKFGIWDLEDERKLQDIAELGRRINRRIELAKISEACG
jgi:hypothetical protein